MKAYIQKSDLNSLALRLNKLCNELDDITYIYKNQIADDLNFTGDMAAQYQRVLNELLSEHCKMIDFYQNLSKQLIEIEKDFSMLEENLLDRINNL